MVSGVDKAIRRAAARGYDPYNMADAAGAEWNRMRRRSGWVIQSLRAPRNAFPLDRGVSYVPRNSA